MQVKRWGQLDALRQQLGESRWLLCVDLEATCDDYPAGLDEAARNAHVLEVQRHEMETIEIGIALLDVQLEYRIVDHFGQFVRPLLRPKLTEFCTGLTGISQSDVDTAERFSVVQDQLGDWLAPRDTEDWRWCSWGDYDRKQLKEDAVRAGVDVLLDPARHINLKKCFWKIFACRALGLKCAVESIGLSCGGQASQRHRRCAQSGTVSAVTAQREATDLIGRTALCLLIHATPWPALLASSRHLTSTYGTHLDNTLKRFNA